MSRAKIVSGFALAMLAAASVFSLADGFLANDAVNLVAAAAFAVLVLTAKAGPGLLIGIDSAVVYMCVPLVLAQGLGFAALLSAAGVAAAAYGIVDLLKIEEVLAAEKAPIRKEHVAYILIAVLLGVFFAARAVSVLAKADASAQDRMTAVADLILVAVWAVLVGISIVNADKRVESLAGIMSSGAALSLGLALYLVVDALARSHGLRAGDVAVALAMSIVFLVLAYRLLRARKA